MKDALAPLVRTNLDLHFGRLSTLTPDPADHAVLIGAASSLVRHISEHVLCRPDTAQADTTVQRHVFGRNAALPPWLVNKGLVLCENDQSKLEPAVRELLKNTFNFRRFLDYLSSELLYHCWVWTKEDEKERWPVRIVSDLRENKYCLDLNTFDYVMKFEDNIIGKSNGDEKIRHWYLRSIGSLTLMDFASKPVFEFTARLVEAKYKTAFVSTIFRNLFETASQGPLLGRFGVLVLGDIPKAFGLGDFAAATLAVESQAFPRNVGVLELFRHILDRFDNPSARRYPEARFRMGGEPPQALINRVGAMYWLRKTMDAAKAIQQKKAAPSRGLRVEERTVLNDALKQKSILYFRLFDDPNDSAINPCYIKSITDDSMVLQSPRGNRLNDARTGQEVHGYFSITGTRQKSTYCDFRANVLSVTVADANHALVGLSLPAAFELTRRTHKRLPLDPSQLAAFELCSPALGVNWSVFTSLEQWPAPFCIIPDGASHCHIKDLSAGGLMLEIHEDAPAYNYFIDGNKDYPLLALMHLVGRSNIPDLKLGLRLETKSIRDFPPLHKKYVGFQFTEAGEVRKDRLVRFTTVGKDGIFLINDWIFRNSIGR